MSNKFTPGPWIEYNNVVVLDVNDDAVCVKPDDEYKGSKNWQVNARLIAAAPELLEALEEIVNVAIECDPRIIDLVGRDRFQIARAAIAKAKGES